MAEVDKPALALPEADRALLAYRLMASLPDDVAYEVEGYLEANRRNAEMDANPSACITLEEMDEMIRKRFPFLEK
jgi:putative addiction module component (TIGR02574 family)